MTIAEQLLRSVLEGVENGFAIDVPALYGVEAEVRQPFGVDGCQPIRGSEEIAAHFDRAAKAGIKVSVKNLRVHQSLDSHVVIAEYDYEWSLPDGSTFDTANVQVIEERDGLIHRTRDYHDTAAIRAGLSSDER